MQKNNAKVRALQPRLETLRKQCGKDGNRYNKESLKLQEEAEINPTEGTLKSVIEMVLLYSLIRIVYKPLTYMLGIDSTEISNAISSLKDYLGTDSLGSKAEITLIGYVHSNPELFTQELVNKISSFNSMFLGVIDLTQLPSFSNPTSLIIPALSALLQVINALLSAIRSKEMDKESENRVSMCATSFIMIVFSIWLSFGFPSGVGLYWLLGSIMGFLQSQIFYILFNKKKAEKILEKALNSPNKKKIWFYEFNRFMQEKTKAQERMKRHEQTKEEKIEFYRLKINYAKEVLQEKYNS
jgi:YidC/Oxa1 family membrane protein insertase